jgi:nucleoside-diphosphate-sugar epimerase
MKYIVTGGCGFIGSNLVDKLINLGHEVTIFDDLSSGKVENLNEKARFIEVDISSDDELSECIDWFDGVDTVFHTAAKARVQPSIIDPITFNKTNVDGTLTLLKMAVDSGVRRFVYSASSSAYGNTDIFPTPESHSTNPLSPYGAQKLMGEIYCKTFSQVYDIETVSLRYFNVYGERQLLEGAYCLVMGIFVQQRLNNEPMTIRGDGEQRRDFTYVGDVVDANIKASQSDKVGNGEVINIGNGDNRSVNQIADMIGGNTINVEPVIEPKETLADNSKARDLLDWKPTMIIENWMDKYKKEVGL